MEAVFCPACCWWAAPLNRDTRGRARQCPTCRSYERHRFLALLLPALAGRSGGDSPVVVDIAPNPATDGVLDRLWPGRRLRLDFDPAADGRKVDVRASMTEMPLADGSVDVLLSSHVLEHIPDDHAAMRDTARVLHPDGIGVIAVPFRSGPTDEDVTAGPAERIERFGQADHVRYYGDDLPDRLGAAGLATLPVTPRDVLDPETVRTLGLDAGEHFWLVQPETADAKLPTYEDLNLALGSAFHESLRINGCRTRDLRVEHRQQEKALSRQQDQLAELKTVRSDLRRAQRRLESIQSHPLYRAARRARKTFRTPS